MDNPTRSAAVRRFSRRQRARDGQLSEGSRADIDGAPGDYLCLADNWTFIRPTVPTDGPQGRIVDDGCGMGGKGTGSGEDANGVRGYLFLDADN